MHRHFMDHVQQPPNAGDVNFMAASTAAAAAAAARLNDNNMEQMTTNNTPNGSVPNFNKLKKSPDDYDKFVDIVKNIVDNHKNTPDKIDAFGDFIKSYIKRWPERLQDEAVNHITNYVIVKNMEHTISSNVEGASNRQ